MSERRLSLKTHILAPSSYDDKGRLKQYSRILMRSPAFAIIEGILDKAADDYGINVSIVHHNERLERGDGYIRSIIDDKSAGNSLTIINTKIFEVPRAVDIARELKKAGKLVALGGPGITLADISLYKELIKESIPFNVGEGENTIPQLQQDAVEGRLKPVYWQKGFVDMRLAPPPKIPHKEELKKVLTKFAAIDISEGCPYICSFCPIRKARGSNTFPSRCRPVEQVVAFISEAHDKGLSVMVIDDNLRMAYTYPQTKQALIALNEEKKSQGRALYLFGQADVRPDIIAEIPDLAAMGYRHLFFGMETKDKLVLAESKKKQNDPELYQVIADECRKYGIAVSTGRMVDFPPQTPESIHAETLEFCGIADIINNFLTTPMIGTDDNFEAVRKGQITDWDLNNYDSTHSVRAWLKNMTQEEAVKVYYRTFKESSPIKDIIQNRFQPWDSRTRGRLYSRLLAELSRVYGRPFHPMMDGLPKFPPLALWGRVNRPADGLRGFVQDPNDPAFISPKNNTLERAKFLSKVAWSPEDKGITSISSAETVVALV